MKISNLTNLLQHELRDLYSAEEQIIKGLPKMIEQTSDQDLQQALEDHLEVTHDQKHRLEKIAEEYNFKISGHTCKGMQGIIAEGESLLKDIDDQATKDAAIISIAQRVEHYEIAGYGTALTYAEELEYEDTANYLEETLKEEFEADDALSELAEGGFLSEGINEVAIDDQE